MPPRTGKCKPGAACLREVLTKDRYDIYGHPLAAAVVRADSATAKLSGRRAKLDGVGFYDRQQHAASGFFITPDDIAAMPWAMYPALFLSSAPGVTIAKRQTSAGPSGSTTCKPNVFVDGVLTRLGLGQAVGANNVYAIEVYVTAATVPASFQAPMSEHACGSLVVWTKKYAP